MAQVTPNYATSTALTITLASLASDTNLLTGRESNQVDNTTTKYSTALVEGFLTTGTGPTANTTLFVYVWGSNVSLATAAKDTLDGTDSAETLTNAAVRDSILKLAVAITSTGNSNVRYDFGDIDVASVLGLSVLPPFWGVFVAHNTVAALNATGSNHAITYSGVKYDIA